MTDSIVRYDPVFVIGYQRSGTTMVRLIINRHPDVFIPREADTFEQLPRVLGRKVYEKSEIGEVLEMIKGGPLHHLMDFDFLYELLDRNLPMSAAGIIACLYQSCAEVDKRGCRWGDKKPQKVWQFIYRLKQWYPGSQFVHIVRDPRDVIASIRRYIDKGVVFFSVQDSFLWRAISSHILISWQWQYAFDSVSKQGRSLNQSGPSGERYMRLQYERLVHEPEECVSSVCEFLNLDDPHIEDMLRFQKDAENPRVGHPNEIFMGETKKRVNTQQIGKFESELSQSEIGDIEFVCRRAVKEMGYETKGLRPNVGRRIYLTSLCWSLGILWKAVRGIRRVQGHL